jgi:hypothetical protein
MSNTVVIITRLRMPSNGFAALGCAWMTTEHTAVVSAYQPSSDARNAAKGGASAWGPPV